MTYKNHKTWLEERGRRCGARKGELLCTRDPGHEKKQHTGASYHYDLLARESWRTPRTKKG